MAEGIARSCGWNAFSAGVNPSKNVNPYAIKVMDELSIDISRQKTNPIDDFVNDDFDIVATVCNHAKENCPIFTGSCKKRLHRSFIDPYNFKGSDEEITSVYRQVRDQISDWIQSFAQEEFTN